MGDRTAIEWTDATWNPIVGCSKVSPGCDNCYAIGVANRGMTPHHRGLTIKTADGIDWNGEIHRAPDNIFTQPLRWSRPRRIFVNSLSDLFHPGVSVELIEEVLAVIACSPQHTFQMLTKRPQRMAEVMSYPMRGGMVAGAAQQMGLRSRLPDVAMRDFWPLPNLWVGVSIESNRYAFRAAHLRATPAAVRWVSAEPLIGPLDELDLSGIDWIVAGGESGPGARPMHPEWVRDLRDRCTAHVCPRCRASFSLPLGMSCPDHHPERGPAFLLKQWGDWRPAPADRATHVVEVDGRHHGRFGEPLSDIAARGGVLVEKVGKKVAGRELDGRTWDEYPA